MPSKSTKLSDKAHLPFRTSNKQRRQTLHLRQKRARDSIRRTARFALKKEEAKDPRLREERLRRNVPVTLDKKRTWDDVDIDLEGGLGASVDVEQVKRRKLLEEEQALPEEDEDTDQNASDSHDDGDGDDDDDADSMLDDTSDISNSDDEAPKDPSSSTMPFKKPPIPSTKPPRATSPTHSTASTNLSLAPEALAAKFPTLFNATDPPPVPKILITTSLNSTLHAQAETLTTLFPHSVYIRRTAHRYGHKFSVREISIFASHRNYTSIVVLEEDSKRPSGLTIVHLPSGPTFHFSISNWVDGAKLPNHGRPTSHTPELILNNFRTPLGLLTAQLFRSLFPAVPQLQGRQVVTLHNQRDYIFVRRHRYVFRDKRPTEKSVTSAADGKDLKGVEEIRAGLQELGPRFTLKLRRVDKGIQRASGQEWQWKGNMEKVRTRFQL